MKFILVSFNGPRICTVPALCVGMCISAGIVYIRCWQLAFLFIEFLKYCLCMVFVLSGISLFGNPGFLLIVIDLFRHYVCNNRAVFAQ